MTSQIHPAYQVTYIDADADRLQYTPDRPWPNPGRSHLHIQFSDLSTAKNAAIGQLDQLAAVGSGRLTVAGLTPLAHDIEVLLDRIDVYLR